MNIILLGAPGAGKGTCASRLKDKLNVPHISTGDIFRENIRNNTPLGQKAKSFIDKGQLVPDEVVIDIVDDRLQKEDCAKGYILDGFPRTIPQAEALSKIANINLVVNIVANDKFIVDRLSGRRVCKCGHTSHLEWMKGSNVCPVCGGELYLRDDDKEETVKERLNVYHKETAPLIEFYKNEKLLVEVDGEAGADSVLAETLEKLNDYNQK